MRPPSERTINPHLALKSLNFFPKMATQTDRGSERASAWRLRGARLIGGRCKLRLDLSNLLPDEIDHKTRAWREMPSR